MKLKLKGNYTSESQLPVAVLPENAVRFVEPEDPAALNKEAGKFVIVPIILMVLIAAVATLIRGGFPFHFDGFWITAGFLLSFVFIVPHELLHAICFGKDDEVELYYSLKAAMAFVVCPAPVSKSKFIWLSLCPNIFLGWLPYMLWAVLPLSNGLSQLLFGYSMLMICMGAGDYMNAYNAWKQMPKGSMQVLSGFHSYWYMP